MAGEDQHPRAQAVGPPLERQAPGTTKAPSAPTVGASATRRANASNDGGSRNASARVRRPLRPRLRDPRSQGKLAARPGQRRRSPHRGRDRSLSRCRAVSRELPSCVSVACSRAGRQTCRRDGGCRRGAVIRDRWPRAGRRSRPRDASRRCFRRVRPSTRAPARSSPTAAR